MFRPTRQDWDETQQLVAQQAARIATLDGYCAALEGQVAELLGLINGAMQAQLEQHLRTSQKLDTLSDFLTHIPRPLILMDQQSNTLC